MYIAFIVCFLAILVRKLTKLELVRLLVRLCALTRIVVWIPLVVVLIECK
jgi:hypothetical protein